MHLHRGGESLSGKHTARFMEVLKSTSTAADVGVVDHEMVDPMVFEDAPEDVLEPAIAYDQNVFEECEESVGHGTEYSTQPKCHEFIRSGGVVWCCICGAYSVSRARLLCVGCRGRRPTPTA